MTGITLPGSIWQGYRTMQEEGEGLSLRADMPYFVSIEKLQFTWQYQRDLPIGKQLLFLKIEYSQILGHGIASDLIYAYCRALANNSASSGPISDVVARYVMYKKPRIKGYCRE